MRMSRRIVIAGAGQCVSRWQAGEANPPSPHTLRVTAARKALGGPAHVDVLAVVRTTEDSLPTSTYPFGRNANPPGTLARDLGLEAGELIYSGVGGQTPQALTNELANRIHAGEIGSALIVGAEAVGAQKAARRAGLTLDWADDDARKFADRGAALDWLDPDELRHGLHAPAQYYGLCETALAHERGVSPADHRKAMSELLAPFSDVAATNPYAMFPRARTAGFLAAPSPENHHVTSSYLKWHVAQDAVNQGAAVLLMGSAEAARAGRAPVTYLRGGGGAEDAVLSRWRTLSRSVAMDAAVVQAFDATEVTAESLDALDLYSCFPVVVWSGLAALGLDTGLDTERTLTVTGGLPFFGGPGNNYSLHAVAQMHARLSGTDRTGLVLANGGWMSKQAVGLYSGAACDYVPTGPFTTVAPDVERCRVTCTGVLEAFTILQNREGPRSGTAFVRTDDGQRALAMVSGAALERVRADPSPVGARVRVDVADGIGHLAFEQET